MRRAEDLLVPLGVLGLGHVVLDEIISDSVIEHPLQLNDDGGGLGVLELALVSAMGIGLP